MAGTCECANELSGSIKCEEFLGKLRNGSQGGLCSMESVSRYTRILLQVPQIPGKDNKLKIRHRRFGEKNIFFLLIRWKVYV